MNKGKLRVSIGVMAFNEQANIGKLLDAFLSQELQNVEIQEIIVVSSACQDKTDEIVEKKAETSPLISLIKQPNREGKSSAINLFLQKAKADICLLSSADVLPQKDVVQKLIEVFADAKIGISGGRPVPLNSTKTLVGYCVHTLWQMHHLMASASPKLGEMIAFRRTFSQIPPESAVDEASIEQIITKQNLAKIYLPSAIIWNKGPDNFREYCSQRKRIHIGHLWLAKYGEYQVASSDSFLLLKILAKQILAHPFSAHKILLTVAIETACRLKARLDFSLKKSNPTVWNIAKSTKNLDT